MGPAIALRALSIGLFAASVIFFFAGRGLPAGAVALAYAGLFGACYPLFIRRERWPNGIPATLDVWLAGTSTGLYLLGLITAFLPLVWASLLFLTAVVIRLAWYPFRAKDAPPGIKAAMGVLMGAVLLLTVLMTVLSLMSPFPSGRAFLASVGWRSGGGGTPTPTPGSVVPPAHRPVAVVGGREIPRALLEYQMKIEAEIGGPGSAEIPSGVAKLVLGTVAKRVLERTVSSDTLDLEMARESTWRQGRVTDPAVLARIKALGDDNLFIEVFVGLNGYYLQKLRATYELGERDRLQQAAMRVLGRVCEADGKAEPIESVTGEPAVQYWWSTKRRAFVSLFETEEEAQEPPKPADPIGAELWKLKPWTALPRPIPEGRAMQIVRRTPDSPGGRPRFEVVRVKEDTSFEMWFTRENRGIDIEIADPSVAAEVRRLAPLIRHLVKEPAPPSPSPN